MPSEIMNCDVFTKIDDIALKFKEATPFKHTIIDNFLNQDLIEKMLEFFPTAKDPSKLLNEFGGHNPKSARSDVRNLAKPFRDLDIYIQSEGFLSAMSTITGIPDLEYDPWYYGAGTHENFHGAGLDAHYDFNIHPKTAYHRRINAIIYLNKDWNPKWRGDICFHTNPWDLKNDIKKSVQPEFNRCVIFETTENSWHSVTPVELPENLRHLSRKSFTIYLYTKTRPESETAPKHATVYVQPPLPAHICEGRTLTAHDMKEINRNITKRHEYLRNLYKREYTFSKIIENLTTQVEKLKRASYVPILGNAKLKFVTSPLYPDGWMGNDVVFTIETRALVNKFTLTTWLPNDIEDIYNIRFQVEDDYIDHTVRAGFNVVELTLTKNAGSIIEVNIISDATRKASDLDQRDISVIIESIILA